MAERTARLPQPRPGTPPQAPATWPQYLAATEAALQALTADLAAQRPPNLPELLLPQGPPPPQHRERAIEIARLLADAAEQLQQEMSAVRHQLATTPRHPAGAGSYEGAGLLGGSLDLNG